MKLIIINGPCGIGKSTLAKSIHNLFPLSYLLDIDAHSRNISHYREYTDERRDLRDAVSKGILEATLSVGRSVVLEKMIYSNTLLDSYYQIAKKYNADIHEIILWAPKDLVMKRADDRGWKVGGLLTPEKCELFWDEIDKIKEERTMATIVDVTSLSEKEVYIKVLELLK